MKAQRTQDHPEKTSVDSGYCVVTMLENVCLPTINSALSSGFVLKRCMVSDRSACIFTQQEAPAQRSAKAQRRGGAMTTCLPSGEEGGVAGERSRLNSDRTSKAP